MNTLATLRGKRPSWSYSYLLTIPDYCPVEPDRRYPGGIKPGQYTVNEVVNMLRRFKHEPDVIQFIADLMEK